MSEGLDMAVRLHGSSAWGVFRPAVEQPPGRYGNAPSTPVQGRLLADEGRAAIAYFMPAERAFRGPAPNEAYDIRNWLIAQTEQDAWNMRQDLVLETISMHEAEAVRLAGLLCPQPPVPAGTFLCRALSGGYCRRWSRECVGWENCGISREYAAPCPYCEASSPADDERCAGCRHEAWKAANYAQKPEDYDEEQED